MTLSVVEQLPVALVTRGLGAAYKKGGRYISQESTNKTSPELVSSSEQVNVQLLVH